jgi:hypothetical protein
VFNFPINGVNCEGNPAPVGCPVPESVPSGLNNDGRGDVGKVEGRRDVTAASFGTAGLIVPKSLLVGGTTLTFSLLADAGVYDLYVNHLTLTDSAVPEPGPFALLALGLVALLVRARKA